MIEILVVGSVALDDIDTPFGQARDALGGSAVYFSAAASAFASTGVVGVVGSDYPLDRLRALKGRNVNFDGLEVREGTSFRWAGAYDYDLNSRETLLTELGVFGEFQPTIPEPFRGASLVFLGNIDPKLQLDVLNQVDDPKMVLCDTMNYWIEGSRPELLSLLERVDMLLVKRLFSGPEAGLYAGAITLARSIALIYGPFGIMLLPAFVSQGASGPPPFRMVLRVVGYFLAAAALPLAAFALWPEEILTLAFGEQFGAAAPLLLPLAGAAALAGLSALIGNSLAGLGRFRFLGIYLGGLLLLISGLLMRHDSIAQVAVIVLLVQAITAAAMLLLFLATSRMPWDINGATESSPV